MEKYQHKILILQSFQLRH